MQTPQHEGKARCICTKSRCPKNKKKDSGGIEDKKGKAPQLFLRCAQPLRKKKRLKDQTQFARKRLKGSRRLYLCFCTYYNGTGKRNILVFRTVPADGKEVRQVWDFLRRFLASEVANISQRQVQTQWKAFQDWNSICKRQKKTVKCAAFKIKMDSAEINFQHRM